MSEIMGYPVKYVKGLEAVLEAAVAYRLRWLNAENSTMKELCDALDKHGLEKG